MKKNEHITEQIRTLAVDIDTIFPDTNNANTHNDKNLQVIKDSITRFGQTKPIIVRKKNKVIACGNGTWQAMKQLGYTTIAANIIELTESEAKALAIIDNRASELSEWDDTVLQEQLLSLKDDFDLSELGFEETDIAELANEMTPPEQFESYDETIPTQTQCPKCKYKW